MNGAISHASRRPPDVILRRSFTRPSTVLAVIEGLGTRLKGEQSLFYITCIQAAIARVWLKAWERGYSLWCEHLLVSFPGPTVLQVTESWRGLEMRLNIYMCWNAFECTGWLYITSRPFFREMWFVDCSCIQLLSSWHAFVHRHCTMLVCFCGWVEDMTRPGSTWTGCSK